MNIGTGPEANFRDGCLSLRAATLDKMKASQSPGFYGQVPNGLGRQPLSNFRTQPVVGWGHYTGGVNDKGRPVETLNGKGTPGPQYQLDKLTCGQQVQSRFRTAPTPVFGSSQRAPINEEGCVSPGPMTAAVNVNAQPPGPKYSMAGAPWRKERTVAEKSPGPGEYNVYGCLGEQKESTRTSFKGFGFGGSGVTREMTLPTRNVPGPGQYAWAEKDRPKQPGGKFGLAAQRPLSRKETRPAPGQYTIPSTMGNTPDSKFRTVVAPGFGTPPPIDQRPHSAAGRLGGGPGPGAYDVGRVDSLAVSKKPLSTDKSCLSFQIKPPSIARPNGHHERKLQELDPESLRRAVESTRKGCRVPNISFGVGPQRPVENPGKCPGPQAYDPESLRRAVSACKSSPIRGVKFGTGPQRHNMIESGNSPGPNASYVIPSTMGAQSNSMFESVKASSFGNPPKKPSRETATNSHGPGPADYKPTFSNLPQTTHGLSFGGAAAYGKGGGARGAVKRSSTPGPGAYAIGSGLGAQTSSKYRSGTAPSFRSR